MPGPLKRSAELLAARDLQAAVSSAVKLAESRLTIPTAGPSFHIKWELLGRRVKDLATADKFSNEVVAQLGAKGLKVDPAIAIIDKRIIAGFRERIALPVIREII